MAITLRAKKRAVTRKRVGIRKDWQRRISHGSVPTLRRWTRDEAASQNCGVWRDWHRVCRKSIRLSTENRDNGYPEGHSPPVTNAALRARQRTIMKLSQPGVFYGTSSRTLPPLFSGVVADSRLRSRRSTSRLKIFERSTKYPDPGPGSCSTHRSRCSADEQANPL